MDIYKKLYELDDEMYIVSVLNGMAFGNSYLDNLRRVNELMPPVDYLESITRSNIKEAIAKGSQLEIELFKEVTGTIESFKPSFGYYTELVISALNSNQLLSTYEVADLLKTRVLNYNCQLWTADVARIIEPELSADVVITREVLDGLTTLLQGRRNNGNDKD
ncbi:unnamed protein product [Fructobacillus fructosus]|uniref:hypothetical protein n=1 Tax=Fructobacillus fructosus TaxID=1631 RepID=UPI002DAE553B|nr:unnamed protein product [Fructobacillus fructosus]